MRKTPWERRITWKLYEWCVVHYDSYPVLRLMFHPPMEKARFLFEKDFIRHGIPDLVLPVARKGYHGLFIELKREKGGKVTPEQSEYIEELNNQGYFACVACGLDEAVGVIRWYLDIEEPL